MRHLALALFLGAYTFSFGQIDTLQSGFGGVVVISGLNQLDSLTWEVTVSSSNWKGAWDPSANSEFPFTEISASDNFFVNCTVFRVNLIDDPVPGVIKVLTIERPAGVGNDPIVGLNAAIFDRTSVQRLPRINRAITEPGEIGLSREDYECLMNDLVARVEANTADAVRRDSTFLINFVSDTSLLSPLQGDRFINASRDTLGMFDSGAWRFFLGLSELPDSIVYAYELDSNLTVLTGYIDSVDMVILTAISDSLDALTSSLTNPYIPYWNGSKFVNSPAFYAGDTLRYDDGTKIFHDWTTSGRTEFDVGAISWKIERYGTRGLAIYPTDASTSNEVSFLNSASQKLFEIMPGQKKIEFYQDFSLILEADNPAANTLQFDVNLDDFWTFQRSTSTVGQTSGFQLKIPSTDQANAPFFFVDESSNIGVVIHPHYQRIGIATDNLPDYSLDIGGSSAAMRLNPTTAPANTEGVWYSNNADDRPHYLNGVTDNALAYTSDLITNNTATGRVPYWDGDSFETSPIYRRSSSSIAINGTPNDNFNLAVEGKALLENGLLIGADSEPTDNFTNYAAIEIETRGLKDNANASVMWVQNSSGGGSQPDSFTATSATFGNYNKAAVNIVNIGDLGGNLASGPFPLSGRGSMAGRFLATPRRQFYSKYSIGLYGGSHVIQDDAFSKIASGTSPLHYGVWGNSIFENSGASSQYLEDNATAQFHGGRFDVDVSTAVFNQNSGLPGGENVISYGVRVLADGPRVLGTIPASDLYNYGAHITAISTAANNYGIYVKADSSDVNWGLYVASGKAYFADTIQAATLPALASPDFFVTADSSGRLHRTENTASANGWESATTDGSGDITVTLPVTMPDTGYSILCQPQATVAQTVTVTARTTTNFTVRFFDSSGSAITSTGVLLHWMVKDY